MASDDSAVQISLPGDQSSAVLLPLLMSCPSSVEPPPVTSTLPSGRTVLFWKARGKFIDATCRHAGDVWVMSMTNAVGAAVPTVPLSAAVPVFRILPGRYMTALCPSRITGSTIDQAPVARFSARVSYAASDEPADRTRPSGSRNMNG